MVNEPFELVDEITLSGNMITGTIQQIPMTLVVGDVKIHQNGEIEIKNEADLSETAKQFWKFVREQSGRDNWTDKQKLEKVEKELHDLKEYAIGLEGAMEWFRYGD